MVEEQFTYVKARHLDQQDSSISLAVYPDGILIGKETKLFPVHLIQQNIYSDIRQCIICDFDFPIERRCIYTFRLNYDVHVMTCSHRFISSCQGYIFIQLDEYNYIILIPKYSDKEFEDVMRRMFSSVWKPKGI